MIIYKTAYKRTPSNLLSHPNKAKVIAPSINLAPKRTTRITAINTNTKLRKGSHFAPILVVVPNHDATDALSFKAAAIPATNAKTENTAMMNPFWKPLTTATTSAIATSISIIIAISIILLQQH